MYRTLIIVTFILNFIASSQAQVLNKDSLHQVIHSDRPYEQQISASLKLLENFESKDFDSTVKLADKALKLARKNKDSIAVAKVKRHVGTASIREGRFDLAEKNFNESLKILEQKKETSLLGPLYTDLGKLFNKKGQSDKATEHFEKAEAIYRQVKDTMGILMIIKESDSVYRRTDDFKKAEQRFRDAIVMAAGKKDSMGLAYALSHLGGMRIIEGKYNEAEQYLLQSLAIREKQKDSFAIAMIYYDLGRAMNGMKNYTKATDYLQTSIRMARRLRNPELLSNSITELASIARNEGKHQDAYNYYLLRAFLLDSLLDMDKTKQIEELRTQFETEEREQRIKQQDERLRLQNYIFIGIGGLLLLTGLLIHSQYKKNKLRQEARLATQLMTQQENATKAVMEAEENERQRIAKDLHDGVGQMISAAKMNLSAFESEMRFESEEQRQSFERIISLVDDSCKEIRTVSHVMIPNALLKQNLPAAIRQFVDKLDNKNIKVHVYTEGLDQRFDSNIETVLYRVVQECVTNAIKHAKASNLDITLVRDKDGITGTIEDNGQGFDPAGKENFDGIGLKNITTRIEYLKGTVDFDSAPGRGTVIAFHVPV
jgi:two-component system, NarL family, sensor kinase